MRLEGSALEICLRHALLKNDALGKTIVILTDNAPLVLAITKGRTSSSRHVMSCCVRIQPTLQHCHPCSLDRARSVRQVRKGSRRIPETSLCAATATHSARAQRIGGGRSLLEDKAAQEATLLSYAKSIATFTTWGPSTTPQQVPGDTLDCHLLDNFDNAFLQGHGSDVGATLFSVIKHFELRFGRNGEQTLPCSHRALQGWKKLAPSNAPQPLPLVGLMAVVGTALHAKLRLFRARDCDRLVDARLRYWGFLLCPTERNVPSKALDDQ